MPDNDEEITRGQDRRLQTLVHELDKKVHALEMSDATHKLEVAYLKGEVSGIRSSTASSFEVKAGTDLTNERIETLRKDVAGIKAILWSLIGLIVTAFIGAVANLVFNK